MYIIADSGSTKTTWCLGDNNKSVCITNGINPFLMEKDDIIRLLETEFTIPRNGISKIYFYGAGCAFPDKNRKVVDALSNYFEEAEIEINSDLLAAARSLCGKNQGIAAILGTGSNSCFYNGQEIVQNVSPLGFILGDEGSGNALGKKLLSDLLKNRLSKEIYNLFFDTYNVTIEDILDNVYRKPFPNRYLAQYAKFVSANINYPEMNKLASDSFYEFLTRNVMQYEAVKQFPVHFTGNVAYHFSDIIKKVAEECGLNVGKITKEPMEGLLEYHN